MPRQRINLIYKAAIGRMTGLERDALLLESVLSDRYRIHHYKITERRRFKQFGIPQSIPSKLNAYARTRLDRFDCNIFLEKIRPELFPLAKLNLLIPNQEMFTRRSVPLLAQIDCVLCKTDYAQRIFSQLTSQTQQIGFSSPDRQLADLQPDMQPVQPDYGQFFHLAGKSGDRRGTAEILRFWQANPNLPRLTVVAHGLNPAPYQDSANLSLLTDYLADQQVQRLQNQIGIHICLSQAEGFGHFIVEAMSAQACVITTNAPPMHELVRADRGYLVDSAKQTTVEGRFDQRFHFDAAAFEAVIWQLVQTPEVEKRAKGLAARRWYEQNQQAFQQKLLMALEGILLSAPQASWHRLN